VQSTRLQMQDPEVGSSTYAERTPNVRGYRITAGKHLRAEAFGGGRLSSLSLGHEL